MYKPYDVYRIYKTVENRVKRKNTKILSEDAYNRRLSDANKDLLQQIADLFNTKFSNVDLTEYIECGFHHFKGFSYDKFFREIVLNEYIARDARKKLNSSEGLQVILATFKHIDRNLDIYVNEMDNGRRVILKDYIMNNTCATVVTYCIWRNLWQPTELEWEYMTAIKNNYSDFEKNVIKFAPLIDKWRKSMKTKNTK